jgi:hypothetical protein
VFELFELFEFELPELLDEEGLDGVVEELDEFDDAAALDPLVSSTLSTVASTPDPIAATTVATRIRY